MSTMILIPISIWIIGIAVMFFMNSRNKNAVGNYLSQYPNAAKIYVSHKGVIVQSQTQILAVNDETPAVFTEMKGYGVYCKPGVNILTVEHSSTRPGVLYKTVTKSTGGVKIEVDIKAEAEYIITFDKETQNFKIDLK
ncbi:hypothetical protein FSBG_00456 [Fusobacterium gonidiaformans 3-1-5R]|uniref:Uncharacterized protein n=1 Tax=Fusobacterium gonidiaformans 3-1-5R TaxID=469605 RepID=E5BFS8_9FUSO|nr:hypothetical protein [Fusobacterium gonidiaformans]AVQ17068.1 hypothetical protein C4N16_05790 [Fusobacterium gonidiaformans ATCC 25563]EFS20959.1 hypothetical protein FSBG_00456 [Fusobacterium gonidiaformans 3-1-5R]EFS29142.1 hypothetical protein FGAG_01463 [Fusobacterium gonidiaformans ATCC 25563]